MERRVSHAQRSSLIPHPSSLIPHPSSFILHPSSFILHPSFFSQVFSGSFVGFHDDGRSTVLGEHGVDVQDEPRREAHVFGAAPPSFAARCSEQAAQERPSILSNL